MAIRVPPLAAAFALLAAALGATAWSTRRTVDDAFTTVREGQALAVEQAVRADLADLGGPPESGDLDGILSEHAEAGLRYVATLDNHGRIEASAGQAIGESPERPVRPLEVTHIGDRLRVEMRASFRRAWGEGGRPWRIVLELEPVQAKDLRSAAERTLAIGIISALVLLAVAVALVRRELVRSAEARTREQERRLAALGEMSAVLAHEIKNPLASLKGNAQLLAASLPEGEKPRQRAERVVDEARRLEQLTLDLLAFVRSGELHRAEASVGELVRAAAGDTPIEVTGDARWQLDGGRMRQVLANLISNAGEAGPPPVRVSVHVAGGKLVIEIADRGPGVPEADRERIFEPFFTNKTRGTGLGLAIARRIVVMHGGTIQVGDAPGGGALFRIEVPS
jgi:two-component system sensor histidine kinase HydH